MSRVPHPFSGFIANRVGYRLRPANDRSPFVVIPKESAVVLVVACPGCPILFAAPSRIGWGIACGQQTTAHPLLSFRRNLQLSLSSPVPGAPSFSRLHRESPFIVIPKESAVVLVVACPRCAASSRIASKRPHSLCCHSEGICSCPCRRLSRVPHPFRGFIAKRVGYRLRPANNRTPKTLASIPLLPPPFPFP